METTKEVSRIAGFTAIPEITFETRLHNRLFAYG